MTHETSVKGQKGGNQLPGGLLVAKYGAWSTFPDPMELMTRKIVATFSLSLSLSLSLFGARASQRARTQMGDAKSATRKGSGIARRSPTALSGVRAAGGASFARHIRLDPVITKPSRRRARRRSKTGGQAQFSVVSPAANRARAPTADRQN